MSIRSDPERSREYTRQWRKANPEKFRGYQCGWRKRNADRVREFTRIQTRRWYLKNKYNLTQEAYDRMLTSQGNACALCFTTAPGGKSDWRIDHCHKTKRVRGLLCHNCNIALGHANDDVALLKRMITYLKKGKTK